MFLQKRPKLIKLHMLSQIAGLFCKTHHNHSALLIEAILIFIQLYTVPRLNGYQFAQDNFIFTVSKFTDPYFAK